MIFAAIAASGSGTRMGGSTPKQFYELGDKPVIVHTIFKFLNFVDYIIVATKPEYLSYMQEIVKKYINKNDNIIIISGDRDRMSTICSILETIESKFDKNDDDIVITHDGVRPFVSDKIICDNIELSKTNGICGTFISTTDTIASSRDGITLDSVPNRSTLYNVQTPQTFKLGILKEIIRNYKNDKREYTDLCGLAVSYGKKVAMVNGDYCNIKLTTQADMKIARGFLDV